MDVLMSNASSINDQLLTGEAYTIAGVYLTFIGILAFCSNSFVLLVLIKGQPKFNKIHTALLFSMAVSDLLVSCTAYPLTAVSCYQKKWAFNDTTCILCGFLVFFLVLCNIHSLCVLAFTRYILVCRPDFERYIHGRKMITVWIVAIIAFALLWAGFPLVGWSSYSYEPFQTSCTLNWYGKTTADRTYNVSCIVLCYCLPVGFFSYCYYNVAKTSIHRAQLVSLPPNGASNAPIDVIVDRITRNVRLRDSRHMTYICFGMVVTFAIIWLPYALLTMWNLIATPVSSNVQVLPTMFANSAAFPIQ